MPFSLQSKNKCKVKTHYDKIVRKYRKYIFFCLNTFVCAFWTDYLFVIEMACLVGVASGTTEDIYV